MWGTTTQQPQGAMISQDQTQTVYPQMIGIPATTVGQVEQLQNQAATAGHGYTIPQTQAQMLGGQIQTVNAPLQTSMLPGQQQPQLTQNPTMFFQQPQLLLPPNHAMVPGQQPQQAVYPQQPLLNSSPFVGNPTLGVTSGGLLNTTAQLPAIQQNAHNLLNTQMMNAANSNINIHNLNTNVAAPILHKPMLDQGRDIPNVCITAPTTALPNNSTGMKKTGKLLLVVLNYYDCDEPMLEEFFWLFSQFGHVEKLSFFEKHKKRQLLVQYQEISEAELAFGYLCGHTLCLNGRSCYLAIVYSNQPFLKFQVENDKNKDYTARNKTIKNPPHPYNYLWGEDRNGEGWLIPQQHSDMRHQIPISDHSIPEGIPGQCLHVSGLAATPESEEKGKGGGQAVTVEELWNVAGQYGRLVSCRLLVNHPECALLQFKKEEEAQTCLAALNNAAINGRVLHVKPGKHGNALHWSGAKTELQDRMCCLYTHRPVLVSSSPGAGSPSGRIVFYNLPQESDTLKHIDLVSQILKHESMLCVSIHKDTPSEVTVTFGSTDEAFNCIANLNGEIVGGICTRMQFLTLVPLFQISIQFLKGKSKKNNRNKGRKVSNTSTGTADTMTTVGTASLYSGMLTVQGSQQFESARSSLSIPSSVSTRNTSLASANPASRNPSILSNNLMQGV